MPTAPKTNDAPTNTPAVAADPEIVVTRTFDAPPEKIFELFTDPKHLIHWWGGTGTATVSELDLRVGGTWRIQGDCGPQSHFVFTRIERPNHLEWVHAHGPQIRGVVTFMPVDGKTEMTARMIFPNVETFEQASKFGAGEMLNRSFNRMAAYAATA